VSARDIVVAGLGNVYRGDDAIGPMVAGLLAMTSCAVRDVGPLAEPLDLLGRFDGADLAIVIDAVRSGAPSGSVHVLDVDLASPSDGELGQAGVTSTHGIGLVGVLRLATAVGRAPRRMVLVAVEGTDFELGATMSDEVRAAVPRALQAVTTLIERNEQCA
jgi:hydrogenase maturation protease